jgi:hypothetical protein
MCYTRREHRSIGLIQLIGAVGLALLFSSSATAKKTDVIVFNNGDRVTGEIKAFERGQLRFSTTAMGTVMIKWDNIDQVISDKTIQLEMDSGQRMLGSLGTATEAEHLQLKTATGERGVPMENVVHMVPIKKDESLWRRLEGSITFGLDYSKGSRVGQSNMGATASLKEEKYQISADWNYNLTRGSQQQDTARWYLGAAYQHTLRNRWFWLANSNLDKNEELGLDLRWLAGGGAGRYIWQSNFSELRLFGGAAGTQESRANVESVTSLEGQFGGRYSVFIFNPNKMDLNVNLDLYPGITESGRWRGNFRTELRWEMIKDLFWNLTYYYTFDNQPPPGAARDDTGVNTGLGYSF